MADYDVSVYKDVLLAFSELTLCFLCQKQATDCKSVVNGLQRYEKWNISWMCLHKHSQLTLFYQTSTEEVTHKIRMKQRVSFKWHDMHVKVDKSHHLTTMLSLCTTDRSTQVDKACGRWRCNHQHVSTTSACQETQPQEAALAINNKPSTITTEGPTL
jgi:hypothetical protein